MMQYWSCNFHTTVPLNMPLHASSCWQKSAIIKESMGQPHGFQPLKMIENVEQKSGPFKNFPLYTVAECQRRNSCMKVMVLHCWHYPGLAGSTDCHVNVSFQSFCPRLICCSLLLSSAPLLPSQPHSCMALNCFVCYIAYTRFAVLVWCSDVYIVPDLWCGHRSTASASSTTTLGLMLAK